jgi:hypothetical protein
MLGSSDIPGHYYMLTAVMTATILIYNNVYNSSAGSAEYDGIHTELLYAVPRFDDGESS